MNKRLPIVFMLLFVLSLASFICKAEEKITDQQPLPDWVMVFLTQHLNFPAGTTDAVTFSPEYSARGLLDSLLNEDTIQPLLADYDLRIEFGRVAAFLRVPIAAEFTKVVQSEDPLMQVRAMLWADGLMRLAPRKREQIDLMHDWEIAKRPWSRKNAVTQLNDANAFGEYIAFSKTVGVDYESKCPYEMSAAYLLSAGSPDPDGEASTSWWRSLTYGWVGGYYWGRFYQIVLQEETIKSRWNVTASLDLLTCRTDYIEGFIEALSYFRPLFPIAILGKAEAKQRRLAEGAPLVIDALLEVWGIWLDQQ